MRAVLCLALGLAVRLHGETITITFDGPPAQPPNTQFAIQQYTEAGFIFKPFGPLDPAPPYRLIRNGGGIAAYPADGSAYLQTAFGGSLEFSRTNGAPFDLVSVDLAEYSTVFQRPATVTFSGRRADGIAVTTNFVTDGVIDGSGPTVDFQTFLFGPEFSNLIHVEVPTIIYSLDNLVVSFGPVSPPAERTIVNVAAIDSEAREISPLLAIPENPAVFRISRSGGTNAALSVAVRLSGTASNGVDYAFISNSVVIPAGAVSADVYVAVKDDVIAEGTETVLLSLLLPPCLDCAIGSNATATAYIFDNDSTNAPPFVWISRPQDAESFAAPANILLRSVANDPENGYDISVEFYQGTNRIGVATFIPSLCPAVDCPSWDLMWSNVPPGSYTLTAKAKDKAGATGVSAPVHITVVSTNPPPPEQTVVTVVATDSEAVEPVWGAINQGQFAIRRTGNLAASIPVSFTLSGGAINGTDYIFISNRVVIPAGATQALVQVSPLADGLAEGTETVILTLESPICVAIFPPPPECYVVGERGVAQVFIRDALVTNQPPMVQVNQPLDGDVFTAPANIILQAYAQDTESSQEQLTVEFFVGTNSLGFGAFVPTLCPSPLCPFYAFTWSNVPTGFYALTARARDSAGAASVSAPVHIEVRGTNSPPPIKLWELNRGIVYGAPAVGSDGTVYVVAGNAVAKLYALTNGVEKWVVPLGAAGSSPAIASDGTIYVGVADGVNRFEAYSPNGTRLWATPLNVSRNFQGLSSPAIGHDGTIYVGTDSPDRSLVALRPDGTLKWKFRPDGAFAEVYTPVVGGDDTIYFGSYNDGFYAVNPDGTRRWKYSMNGYSISAAVAGDGIVYVVGSIFPNKLFAFAPDGIKKWESQIGPDLSQGSSAPVIGLDGTIYVGCGHDMNLYAFNPDGSARWNFSAGGNVGGTSISPAVDSQGNVYLGLGLRLFAVDSSGSQLWSYTHDGIFSAPALTADGVIYVGSADNLYAFQANAGLAQSTWPMLQRGLQHTGAALSTSNRPPAVVIVTPHEGDSFPAGSGIFLGADVFTHDSLVQRVDFYTGGTFIGQGMGPLPSPSGGWGMSWSNPPAGNHVLRAIATDTAGLRGTSAPVNVVVVGPSETNLPMVRVFASDNNASEGSATNGNVNTGQFTFTRTGNFNNALGVFFVLSGTASNGVDYTLATNVVAFSPGAFDAFLIVNPVDDAVVEGTETVELTLIRPPPTGFTTPYNVGAPANATVFIYDNDTNLPPPPEQTVITVVATDSDAAEPGLGAVNIGQFAIRRTGNLGVSIPVFFALGGSAVNGADYLLISNQIVIAAGATQALVRVTPLTDGLLEGTESVALKLSPIACIAGFAPAPECYEVGLPAAAEVFIRDASAPTNQSTVVTVVATDAHAWEPGADVGEPGEFAIRRGGNLSNDLTVFFTLSGSASNGVDYEFISNRVVIAAGSTQAVVKVLPLGDVLLEGTETVVLALQPPVCAAIFPPPPGCYEIASPVQATVFIADSLAETNRAPIVTITITTPTNGSIFAAHANILIVANANDPEGAATVSTVEFFAGDHSLGLRTNYPTANPIGPFFLVWSNALSGEYALTARATDNTGASTVSPAVHVRVSATVTNVLPGPFLVIPPQCFAEVRTNGCRLLLSAETPMTCVIECSIDLIQWTPIYTNTLGVGAVELRDCEGSSGPMRFYRLRQE